MIFLTKNLPYLLIGLFVCASAHADNPSLNKEIAERFARCDKNHDGKLTKEEANGCMPRIYQNFSLIDSDGKGYITVAQIETAASK
jgi:Ca2+-binding EF-hand superfamily protein